MHSALHKGLELVLLLVALAAAGLAWRMTSDGGGTVTGLPAARAAQRAPGPAATVPARAPATTAGEVQLLGVTETAPDSATLTGRVLVAGDTLPVAGVRVQILVPQDAGTALAETLTDDQGAFTFGSLAAGTITVRAVGTDPFQDASATLELASHETVHVELRLSAPADLEIWTVDGTPGAAPDRAQLAIADAVVRLTATGEDPEELLATCRTDGSGVGRLQAIPSGRWLLTVQATGYCTYQQELLLSVAGQVARARQEPGRHVVRLIRPGPRVAGVVTDASGRPLPDALVCLAARDPSRAPLFGRGLSGEADPLAPGQPIHTTTDALGRFTLETLEGCSQQALLVCPGRPGLPPVVSATLDATLLAASTTWLTIRVPPAVDVEVRFEHETGERCDGPVRVSDGRVELGLVDDPLVGRVPGIARWSLARPGPGSLCLALAPGGYQAIHESSSGVPTACYFTVPADAVPTADDQVLVVALKALNPRRTP